MKVYISVDMEGLAGISQWREVDPRQSKESLELLTSQLRAVLKGIMKADRDVEEILISDSHANGDNIPYSLTQEFDNVRIVHGPDRKNYMMAGLDASFDRVFLLGYHAGAGNAYGNMDHTYSSSLIHNLWINGRRMNEALINLGFAGEFNVPLAFAAGDQTLLKELSESIGGKYVYVVTKESVGRYAAIMKPFPRVLKEIEDGAFQAVLIKKDELAMVKFTLPLELKIELKDTAYADSCELIPGFQRIDGRTVVFVTENYETLFNAILVVTLVAGAVRDMRK